MRVFLIVIFLLGSLTTAAFAQDFGQSPYSPGASPRGHYLGSQLRSIEEGSYDPYIQDETEFDRLNVQAGRDRDFRDFKALQTRPASINDLMRLQEKEEQKQSRLEAYYSKRTGEMLMQFGYDLFENQKPRKFLSRPIIGVQDDYILGIGDRLIITFLGERSDRELYTVNQDGQVILTEMSPLVAAGKSIAAFRDNLNAAINNVYLDSKAFVSLEHIKNISVSVIGEVGKPGRYQIAPAASVLDVLIEAHGIRKSGSLRRIKRIRGGKTVEMDLYDVLLGENAPRNIGLRDGDRIIVPVIGASIAVAGEVQRPAIYELSRNMLDDPKLKLEQALDYAGGVLAKGHNRFMRGAVKHDGTEIIAQLYPNDKRLLGEGDVLRVDRHVEQQRSGVTLRGAVRNEGLHSLEDASTLSRLLMNKSLLSKDIYPFLGVIERFDPRSLSRKMVAFSPKHVIEGDTDFDLKDQDEVVLLSSQQIEILFDVPQAQDLKTQDEEIENVKYEWHQKRRRLAPQVIIG